MQYFVIFQHKKDVHLKHPRVSYYRLRYIAASQILRRKEPTSIHNATYCYCLTTSIFSGNFRKKHENLDLLVVRSNKRLRPRLANSAFFDMVYLNECRTVIQNAH